MKESNNWKLEWQKFKAQLTFSHVKCMSCQEYLYFGNNVQIASGNKTASFNCKCKPQIVFNDRCSSCNKLIIYEVMYKPAIRLKCTCGHTATVLTDQLANTNKA